MSEAISKGAADFVLPSNVVTRADVSRLVNEVERVDNEMTAAVVAERVGAEHKPDTVYSPQLTLFLEQNELSLDDSLGRTELIKQLRHLKNDAPVVHMTFASPADPESLQELVSWFRSEAHPQTLIDVGLQPSLVAGVYLRTTNHVYDLSMKAAFAGHHDELAKQMESLRGTS